MWRVALRSILGRWPRLVMTALAIVASTAFLSGTFIYRDTVQRSFDALFAQLFERVDSYVQSPNTVEVALGFERRDRLPVTEVAKVAAVPGVADAQPFVQGDAAVIGKNGEPVERAASPTFGGTINRGTLSVWRVQEGRAPTGPTEVALEAQTAADAGYALGDRVKVNADGGSRTFTLVGIVRYNNIASPGNATWALFDDDTAQQFIAKPGFVDAVLVRGDGTVSGEELTRRINAAVGTPTSDGVVEAQALTRQGIVAQSQNEIQKALGFIGLFLTIFSVIALAVGAFVIYNIFSITAAQRQRETALLRAVGASRRQVTWAMLTEAGVVGLVGSLLGLLGGVGLAMGIRALLNALDFSLPARGLEVTGSTAVITVVAGLATALLAGLAPALAAGRVPPVAALVDVAFERVSRFRSRLVLAAVVAGAGLAMIGAVLAGADGRLLGVALAAVFAGLLVAGPLLARPIARLIGAPVQRATGVTGTMARGNVQRNPKRTARTAAPVLIGVALVTAASVFAASIAAQIKRTVGETFLGDYVVNSTKGSAVSFNPTFVDELNELPEVGIATGLGFASVEFADGKPAFGQLLDPRTAGPLLNYDFVAGSFAALDRAGILVSEGEATRKRLVLGSTVPVRVQTKVVQLTVRGIYRTSRIGQARVYHRDLLRGTGVQDTRGVVVLTRAPGVSDARFREVVGAAARQYGIGELQDRDEFIASRADIVDQSLTFIYGLLALSVVIAVFGIVLTLLLAVYERRREIGLLRAVGMTRRQVRATVRWESVITSLYGAAVGVVMGLLLGWVVILALRDQGLTTYSVPAGRIVLILALSFAIGVAAAIIPARRATKLDVLAAIASE